MTKTETKKWMVSLSIEAYTWIKETSDKADVSGAAVLRSLIRNAMELNSAEFRRELISSQVKEELEEIEEKKAIIADREKVLRLKLVGSNNKERATV